MGHRFVASMRRCLVVSVVVACGLAASVGGAISTAPDLSGVWKVVNTSGPGAAGTLVITNGKGGAFNGTGYGGGYVVRGTVSGNSVRYTVSDSSYTATFRGTLSSDGTRITYSWTDSNKQRGTAYLEKQGAAPAQTPSPVPPSVPCGQIDCSGLQLPIAATIPTGPTDTSVFIGCGASRTTSAHQVGTQESCAGLPVDENSAVSKEWEAALAAAGAAMLAPDIKSLIDLLEGAPNGQLVNAAYQALEGIREAKTPQQDLPKGDQSFAPDFPPDSLRATAAYVHEDAAIAGPKPSTVIKSVYGRAPTRAQAQAFTAALKLATGKTYSPARALARLTLAVAYVVGSREITHETAHMKQVVLGAIHTDLPARTSRTLAVKTSPLGARILRLLALTSLARPTTLHLQVMSTNAAGTTSAKKQLTIR